MNTLKLKNDIKKVVEIQKLQKSQRKTIHLVGDRVMEPYVATYRSQMTSHKLRIMYAAYGLMRGRSYSSIESHYDDESHPLRKFESEILKVMESYEENVCTDQRIA